MPLALTVGHDLVRALSFAGGMAWEFLWALILGFALSGAVQAVVSKGEMRRLLPDDSPRTLGVATALGAASSSCSYAAVALGRSLFRRGADFTASVAFTFASANPVFDLGLLLAGALPGPPPHAREAVGAGRRPARRDRQLRLLGRQRAARRGALERRHQLRRRACVHLRGPDHPPDPEHLPPLLRLADGRIP